ncbi:uncharacterized protein LOC126705726 [Quercus robur]|uniref:uncharacterized protein LOC126705726 n=1 Tax=Quercus robur TaxID=38942 RepID=UPI0021618944|nr:uncharacterized protein LOC126705726 [Quercus robur]
MDPTEEEVEVEEEEEKDWGRLDDLDGEYEICICARETSYEVMKCYTIKVPDHEARTPLSYFLSRPSAPLNAVIHGAQIREYCNFTPKDLSPFSVTTAEEPYTSRYLALLNNHLYSVGGYAKLTRSEFEELRGGEDYPLHGIYMPSRSVWTLDLSCPDLGWKQLDEPMRNRRKDPQTIVVDGKLYVFGGLYGYKPIPEDCSSGRGWMEVYDPILKTWESLPNPPFSIAIGGDFEPIIFAHLELEEDKHEIMVVDLSNSKENNMCADFLKYNVMSSTWETWLQQHWALVDSYTQCGRAVVVDHTKAYWACIISMEKWNTECCIFGFDLKSKRWTRERLNPGPFLGESEYFCWTSPGLLHLSDHKFCLLLSSRNSSHEPSEKASNFLFCIVLDLSAFFYIYSDPDRKPPLSVISIQKYSLDTDIDLLDCMITNRGTQPPKKKKPKTSEEEGSLTQGLAKSAKKRDECSCL